MRVKMYVGTMILTGILLCSSCNSKTDTTQNAEIKPKVEVARLQSRDVDQLSSFSATVEAETTNNIAPQTAARITRIYVEVGDRVAKGQRLAEMDPVNLTQTKLQLENDELEFRRVDELFKIGGTSQSAWDAKKLTYEKSKASYDNLLENTVLVSPINGIVMKRNYDSGDMYGMGAPLFVVEQIRPVKILVNASEGLFTQLKKGQEVDITLDVYGDERFKGNIHLIHPSIDSQTRTFPVEIRIDNRDERIRPGMFARVTFNLGSRNHVMVPDLAIQKQTGSADRFVYIWDNNKVTYRKITVGRRIGEEFEVLSGLEDGEWVVTAGHSRLNSGMEVERINN